MRLPFGTVDTAKNNAPDAPMLTCITSLVQLCQRQRETRLLGFVTVTITG